MRSVKVDLVREDWPRVVHTFPVDGGYICSTQRATLADGRDVIIKRCPYPAAQEAEGLESLRAAGVATPQVVGIGAQVLVLEFVGEPGSGRPDWSALGRTIARLHRHTNERFGWHQDNYAGRFTQDNRWCADWPTFYTDRRVLSHLAHTEVPELLRRRLEQACAGSRSRACCGSDLQRRSFMVICGPAT